MTYEIKTRGKKLTTKEKRYLLGKGNEENLVAAISILKDIDSCFSDKVSKNYKNTIRELAFMLNSADQKMPLSVRAANAISIIDGMTQDGRLDSYVRTMLWRVVSNLEGIRD